MSSPENDRRVARTKKAIEEAFISCVKEKGLDDTRISDIVERADINRGTFYLHYEDKRDFIKQLERSTLDDLKAQIMLAQKKYYEDKSMPSYGYDYLFKNALNYIKTHKERMLILFSLGGEHSFRHKLQELTMESLTEKLYPTDIQKNLQVSVDYWNVYQANAHFGVIEHWLEGGCKESIDEISHILIDLLFATI